MLRLRRFWPTLACTIPDSVVLSHVHHAKSAVPFQTMKLPHTNHTPPLKYYGDDIVVYFCFPTLGVAVPLRPGDYLLFNALIPHCVSSRCRHNDSIMCVSMYLKTAVIGMNNNALSLTKNQAMLAKRYHSIVTDQINCHNRQHHLTARYKKFYASL